MQFKTQNDYVENQLHVSTNKDDIIVLKDENKISVSSLRMYFRAFQSLEAADWKEARPNAELVLEIHNWRWIEGRVLYCTWQDLAAAGDPSKEVIERPRMVL